MKVLFLALMSTMLLSANAHADYSVATCSSVSGARPELALILVNKDVRQVRIRINSRRQRALNPARATEQTVEGVTVYTFLPVSTTTLEVENSILEGAGGIAHFADEEFSCK